MGVWELSSDINLRPSSNQMARWGLKPTFVDPIIQHITRWSIKLVINLFELIKTYRIKYPKYILEFTENSDN